MTLGGDHSLCDDDLTADGAVLTLGQTRLGAGRSLGRIGDLGVLMFLLGDDDLAVCVDLEVAALGKQAVHLAVGEVEGTVLDGVVVDAEVVVVAVLILDETLLDLFAVLVVVEITTLLDDAVFGFGDNDLAVCADLEVAALGKQAVHFVVGEVEGTVLDGVVVEAEVVVVAVLILDETLLDLHVILVVVQIAAFLDDAVLGDICIHAVDIIQSLAACVGQNTRE